MTDTTTPKLEDICVSLELAKQLKAAGYPQESLFYWNGNEEFNYIVKYKDDLFGWKEAIKISAPTASELGGVLGVDETKKIVSYHFWKYPDEDLYNFGWVDADGGEENFGEEKLIDAMAEAWLYLKKENLL